MDEKDKARKEYYDARKENIKDKVSCDEVLEHFGVDLLWSDREIQYRCPLHGDGSDRKRSARYYPDSDSTYCWGCQKARDHIELVRDFQGCSFTEALKYLEKGWDLDDIPSIYEYMDPNAEGSDENGNTGQSKFEQEMDDIFESKQSMLSQFKALERKIDRLTDEYKQSVGMDAVLKLYRTYDRLVHDLRAERMDPQTGIKIGRKLSKKIESIKQGIDGA